MELALYTLVTVLNIADILLHFAGIYLLACHLKTNNENVQHIYILNLTITEVSFTILWLFTCIHHDSNMTVQVAHYIKIIIYNLIAFVFYCTMYFITIDRLIACWSPTKYLAYWDADKAKQLLIGTWSLGAVLCCFCSTYC